jgi:4'-phosphopantetheinyl transferase
MRYTLPQPDFSTPINLGSQQVHMWLLDLRRFGDDHQRAANGAMSSEERARAQKFIRGKESYIASRWLLRTCLAHYTGTTAAAIEFARTDKGKPFLQNSDIHFSLSHSGHWALLAVSQTPLIGVDIEANRRARDLPSIAENYFHPKEIALLGSIPTDKQADYFYRLWTLKEAFFKAIGIGISAGLDNIHFILDTPLIPNNKEQEQLRISATINPQIAHADAPWQFQQWQLPEGDLIALAYAAAEPQQAIWFDALAAPAFP